MRCSHGILVVFNHKNNRKVPDRSHIEGFVNLTLVGCTVPEIGESDTIIFEIFVRKGEPGTNWYLRTDNAVTAIKVLFLAKHMHLAALTFGIAVNAPS